MQLNLLGFKVVGTIATPWLQRDNTVGKLERAHESRIEHIKQQLAFGVPSLKYICCNDFVGRAY